MAHARWLENPEPNEGFDAHGGNDVRRMKFLFAFKASCLARKCAR
jgi:hypothetical protein